jgi:hypothetical protein
MGGAVSDEFTSKRTNLLAVTTYPMPPSWKFIKPVESTVKVELAVLTSGWRLPFELLVSLRDVKLPLLTVIIPMPASEVGAAVNVPMV